MSVQDRPGWARDPIHAAGRRRHYNSVRQLVAELRRIEIVCFLAESGMSLLVRGTQRALAQRFGVSESTISRDLVGILAERGSSRRCPFCGAKPLDNEGARAIEEGHNRSRRWLGLPDDNERTKDGAPVELSAAEVSTIGDRAGAATEQGTGPCGERCHVLNVL